MSYSSTPQQLSTSAPTGALTEFTCSEARIVKIPAAAVGADKHSQLGRAHCAIDQVDEVAPRGLVGVALVKRALICGPDAKIPSEPARLAIAMDSVFMNFYEQ